MDDLDRRILREIQRDCMRSAASLAERCGTTESTALRRIRRMRRDGTIRAEVTQVDPAKAGRPLLLFVKIRLERESGAFAKRFVERIRACPEVIQFFFVTGTSDYVVMLSLRTMEDYDRFLQEYLVDVPEVVLTDSNVVIRPLKFSLEIPIDDG